ncbi:MAG TPA: extracellular solute-binding protein [Thermoleophilaceae bacterium]|nr:extracellular solute-binding protein [Thermoleophilaceae bacterium]
MRKLIALIAAAAALTGCGGGSDDADLVIYSGRSEPLIKPFLEEFAEKEGLNVKIRFGDTADLVGTLLEEGERTRADVFIGQDAAALERLREDGLLQPHEGTARVPERYRASDLTWTGLSGRARVLIVRDGAAHPESVFDLTDPRWRGKLAAPTTRNVSFRDFITVVRLKRGDEFARGYLEGLKRNGVEILASHGEVRRAVGEGEFDIGLVNHYYVELEKREGSDVSAVFTDQEPGGFGVVFNLASAGITASSEHAENAAKLLDYLLTPEVQERFARANFEYPLLPGLEAAPGVRPLEDVLTTEVSYEDIARATEGTEDLIAEAGLEE